MNENVFSEITELSTEDSFLVYERTKDSFEFPIHYHPEFELNLIKNGKGVRRTIGDHMEEIDDVELVFVGSHLVHGWELHNCTNKEIYEITIHISPDMFEERLINKKIFKSIRDMISRSMHGILFSRESSLEMMPRLQKLMQIQGIDYYMEFISIMHDLSNSRNQKMLSTLPSHQLNFNSDDKIKKVYDFVHSNYFKKITLDDISGLINMTPISFNRFIKKRTGNTFVNFLNNIRVGYAAKLLLDSDLTIGEIGFKCGFNNIANFNRVFKKSKKCTPSEFREQYFGGGKRVL